MSVVGWMDVKLWSHDKCGCGDYRFEHEGGKGRCSSCKNGEAATSSAAYRCKEFDDSTRGGTRVVIDVNGVTEEVVREFGEIMEKLRERKVRLT